MDNTSLGSTLQSQASIHEFSPMNKNERYKNIFAITLIIISISGSFIWAFAINDGILFKYDFNVTHVFFCSIGSIIIMGLASFTYQSMKCLPKIASIVIHCFILLIGVVSILLGMYSPLYYKFNSFTFANIHSWIGIAVSFLIFIQFNASYLIHLTSLSSQFREKVKKMYSLGTKLIVLLLTITTITGATIVKTSNLPFYSNKEKIFLIFYSLVSIITFIAIMFKIS